MVQYQCKVIDERGRTVRKSITAANYPDVYYKIEKLGWTPIDIKEIEDKKVTSRVRRLSLKELVVFCRQTSTMLQAGIPIVTAFEILRLQCRKERNHAMANIYDHIHADLQIGISMKDSMEAMNGVFPPMLISIIAAGELTGNIDTVMTKLGGYYDRQRILKHKIDSSLMYPKILLVLVVGVVIGLFTFILPSFFVVFDQLDIHLPLITEILIKISDFMRERWYIIVAILALVVLIYNMLMTNDEFAKTLDYIYTKIYVVREMVMKVSIANFTSTLGLLSSSGVGLLQAVDISKDVLTNRYYRMKLHEVRDEVEVGKMLSHALENAEIFDPMVTSLILIGEESGSLDKMLDMASDFYETEAEQAMSKMVTFIEPIVIVIIGVLVLGVVAAVILPIFSMATQLS